MIVINSSTRQFNIPGADLVFGVESDSGSERKDFQCPRYVGNNLDIAGSFVRINYRNANGEVDSYLVHDLIVDGDNVLFSWELTPKVTSYKGQVSFVVCVTGPDTKLKWHTTLGRGQVLEGLEPDTDMVEAATADVVAQLIALVKAQTEAVETVGEQWVANTRDEGATQVEAVKSAATAAETAAVAEIEAKRVNSLESIPDDYTALSEAVDALNHTRGAAIVCEAEGSAVAVNDASDMPMQGLRIFGRSTQDGTPTPEAPVEIKSVVEPVVTVCGKNLATRVIDYDATVRGVHITASADSSEFTLDGTAETQFSNVAMRSEVLSPGTYTISVEGLNVHTSSLDRIYVAKEIDNKVLANPVQDGAPRTFDLNETTRLRIDLVLMGGSSYDNKAIKVQIEVGEVATKYEPHKTPQILSTTHTLPGIPVTSGGNYTDSDGQQWICDEVDLERGVYVQRTATVVVNGSNNPSTFATGNKGGSVFAYSYDDLKMNILRNRGHKLCDRLQRPTNNNPTSFKDCEIGCWGYNTVGSNDMFIVMNVGKFNSADDVKSWLSENPVTFVYVLATPIEKPLSETEIATYRVLHSNYPNTTILNDSGAHMVVKYAADTKLYIDNKIAALVG